MPGWLQQEQAAGFDRKPRLASLESAGKAGRRYRRQFATCARKAA